VRAQRPFKQMCRKGNSVSSEKYAFKLAWFGRIRRYFETQLDPKKPGI
jgi:hypothetical protein